MSYVANLGTRLRSRHADGACTAVPETGHHRQAPGQGDTLTTRPCVHRVGSKPGWIDRAKRRGARIIGVELDGEAVPLRQVRPATERRVVLLGPEHSGLPPEVSGFPDQVVEIPMPGVGRSLDVAVADSLVRYELAGLP